MVCATVGKVDNMVDVYAFECATVLVLADTAGPVYYV
jgi:hypothetical protein